MTAVNPLSLSPIAADVLDGLARASKHLPARLFYDTAGSALFEEITRLPEYYLTRTEAEILRSNAAEICDLAGRNVTVVELAAGSAEKTTLLLSEFQRRQLRVVYAPVDVSEAALAAARHNLQGSVPAVRVQPVLSDLADLSFLEKFSSPRLILFIGSTIGNLEDHEAVALLRRVGGMLKPSDRLLIGTDLAKDPSILLPAYNDSQGVTARFNRNILRRINRELGGTFDPDQFRHLAIWNLERSRIEMHLESLRDQCVQLRELGVTIELFQGERIHTENSYKYTLPRVSNILSAAGFESERSWCDDRNWYAVHLAHLK